MNKHIVSAVIFIKLSVLTYSLDNNERFFKSKLNVQSTSSLTKEGSNEGYNIQYNAEIDLSLVTFKVSEFKTGVVVCPEMLKWNQNNFDELIPKYINHTIVVVLDNGEFSNIYCDSNMPVEIVNLWKEVVSSCIVPPVDLSGGRFEASLNDRVGQCNAQYWCQDGVLFRVRDKFKRIYDLPLVGDDLILKSSVNKIRCFDIYKGYQSGRFIHETGSSIVVDLKINNMGNFRVNTLIQLEKLKEIERDEFISACFDGAKTNNINLNIFTSGLISYPMVGGMLNKDEGGSDVEEVSEFLSTDYLRLITELDLMYAERVATQLCNEKVDEIFNCLGDINEAKYVCITQSLTGESLSNQAHASVFSVLAARSPQYACKYVSEHLINDEYNVSFEKYIKILSYFNYLGYTNVGLNNKMKKLVRENRKYREKCEKIVSITLQKLSN